ncbi:hypothetical protein LPJ56_000466 [Coemansia sp. RSA 2599]|nr:hypothetical protein LPJ75_000157 [Coemansia sp. RSA 2598]KAJ1829290.1 hypothetical protein LPJ56_000466 [Coemansia sp. RSA 2599]
MMDNSGLEELVNKDVVRVEVGEEDELHEENGEKSDMGDGGYNINDMDGENDSESEYEYETEEFYIVASLPSRALARATDAANDPKGVSARLSGVSRNSVALNDNSSDIDRDKEDSDTNGNIEAVDNNSGGGRSKPASRGGRRRRHLVPQYALIDLDTDQPMLELEGAIYVGRHEELLGTHLLFDIDAEDEEGSERSNVELLGATSKTIIFHPVKMSKNYEYSG